MSVSFVGLFVCVCLFVCLLYTFKCMCKQASAPLCVSFTNMCVQYIYYTVFNDDKLSAGSRGRRSDLR